MKYTGQDAARYLAARKPLPGQAALLLYGADAMRIAGIRQKFLAGFLGANAAEEMRLARFSGAELRSDPAALSDAMKAIGFFPGPRAVLVTEAGEGLAAPLADALGGAAPEDALVLIEAGALAKGSKLRKLVEGAKNGLAIGIYDDPPAPAEVTAQLVAAGLSGEGPGAGALLDWAQRLEPGDFAQLVEKASLFAEDGRISAEEVAAIAPLAAEEDLDATIGLVAAGNARALPGALARLAAQGVAPVTLIIAARRHFQRLHKVATHPGGIAAGMGALRPPVFGPRRSALERQARTWGGVDAERALSEIYRCDLSLRATHGYPQMALLERAFLRIAMMKARGGT